MENEQTTKPVSRRGINKTDESKYCIYLTTNKINGKTYVGQHKYRKLYDGYIGSGSYLQRAIKKYGKENFEIEYLETDLTEDEIDWYEQWYISVLNPDYNLQIGGQGARYRSTMANQELRFKISSTHKKLWMDPEYRDRLVKAHQHPTDRRGKRLEEFASDPDKARYNMSISHKGKEPWNKGKICPQISESQKGRVASEESKQKMSKAKLDNPVRYWKGKTMNEEHRRKLSESHKGKNNTCNEEYKLYKANGGTMSWNDFQKEKKNGRKD